MEWYHEFVDRRHAPGRDDVIALFRATPARGVGMDEAWGRVASESSVGTWTELSQMPQRIRDLKGVAYRTEEDLGWVAYPKELWEAGNLPQLLSGIGGNIFGMKAVRRLRLEDVHLPDWYRRGFAGPQVGIAGLRKALGVRKRPLTATVPKPKLGWTAAEHARIGLEAWRGGMDLIKDDENLTNQAFNRFAKRVARLRAARSKAEAETGDVKSALINVTAETDEARRRMRLLADDGWEYAMVDVVVTGWAALQTLREEARDHGLAIHAHRAMHAMFTKDPRHGMSMPCMAKLLRLAGVDQLHTGTVLGKLESPRREVLASADALREAKVEEDARLPRLAQDWGRMKPAFPVTSGGLHPGIVPPVLDIYGSDVVVQLGGGVHGHPKGPRQGARALLDAIGGWMDGLSLAESAKRSAPLAEALQVWGTSRPQ